MTRSAAPFGRNYQSFVFLSLDVMTILSTQFYQHVTFYVERFVKFSLPSQRSWRWNVTFGKRDRLNFPVFTLHRNPAVPAYSRLISEATYPAPNPLSIFTTLTFDAQEFSIPNSAARPPKEAPYPTLVGTAMTGTLTSPPTTLGNAPSIPAQTITTRASASTFLFEKRRWMPATPTS